MGGNVSLLNNICNHLLHISSDSMHINDPAYYFHLHKEDSFYSAATLRAI